MKKLAWWEYVWAVFWTIGAILRWGVGAEKRVLSMHQEALGKIYGGGRK